MRDELETKDNQLSGVRLELDKVKGEVEEKELAIAKLETELEQAIAKPKPEPEPMPTPEPPELTPTPTQPPEPEPEPTPEPTPEPEPSIVKPDSTPKSKSKSKAKSKANPVQEIDLDSLIIPPGYKVGGTADVVAFALEKFPGSKIKNNGDITDAIRDKDSKAEGSEFSRLSNFEQECGFKHLGKFKSKHKFLIPIA